MTNYYEDYYGWTQEQAELLKAGQFERVDLEHLLEELESMGASERRELGNRLAVLMAHLLKRSVFTHALTLKYHATNSS